MRRIRTDLDEVLSLEDKKKILRDIHQDDLLELFKKGYAPQYRAPERMKENSLDHQISITVSDEEKNLIQKELSAIKSAGPASSLSSFIRSKSTSEIDIEDWYINSTEGLLEFTKPEWNPKNINNERSRLIKAIDDTEDDEETFFLKKKLEEINIKLNKTKKQSFSRGYRVAGRVTYDEANLIRWRAARLTLTVADYIRFLIFGYTPYKDDGHLSLDARKRLYIAIADIKKNGWGEPPRADESDISKLKKENRELKNKIGRYELFIKKNNLSIDY